jgi:hypothetical protein
MTTTSSLLSGKTTFRRLDYRAYRVNYVIKSSPGAVSATTTACGLQLVRLLKYGWS